ncbi:hypothetical protein ACVIHB_009639 [Bradyrhizobium liaoningense]
MQVQMLAATRLTASAPREPVSSAAANRADRPQQHAAGKILAEMIHLPDQRDAGAEDDRTDAGAEIGENAAAGRGKPGAERAGDDHAGEQDREPQQPRDLRPVRRHEGEERGRDQQAADDGDDHGDVDGGRKRRQRMANGGGRRRRNHAVGLPSRQIGFEALPVGFVEHRPGITWRPPDGGALLGRIVQAMGSIRPSQQGYRLWLFARAERAPRPSRRQLRCLLRMRLSGIGVR